MHNLLYPVPNEIYTICALYHNIICPNQHLLRFRNMNDIQDEYNTQESLEWAQDMTYVAAFVHTINPFERDTIWDRVDKQRSGKIDCQKMLQRLIYSLIAMYIKSYDRNENVPKVLLLLPLLQSVSKHIKIQLNSEYITKQDF